jgi:uncharacterized protein (TIGR02001 family)
MFMRLIRPTALTAATMFGACAGAAAAQDVPAQSAPAAAPTFAFGAGAATDYLFRGVSRTDDRGQVFASADAGLDEGYAGVWASNTAFRTPDGVRSGAEVDVYGGWRPEFRGYNLDFGAQYDSFADQPAGMGLDYAELYAKVSRLIGPVTGRLGVHYSPAFTAGGGQAWYAEGGADYAITRDWIASASVGHQSIARPTVLGGGDYLTWNAGITHNIGDHLAVDVRYSDTDQHGYGQTYGSRLVGQIRASF